MLSILLSLQQFAFLLPHSTNILKAISLKFQSKWFDENCYSCLELDESRDNKVEKFATRKQTYKSNGFAVIDFNTETISWLSAKLSALFPLLLGKHWIYQDDNVSEPEHTKEQATSGLFESLPVRINFFFYYFFRRIHLSCPLCSF